jgi:hypothetical protein
LSLRNFTPRNILNQITQQLNDLTQDRSFRRAVEKVCRLHEADHEATTATYQAAAEAVASIPQLGLRAVMTGFLIDSLIATGRFEDARACIVIYPEESERFVALGAIAEAQGKRGAADSARQWIATEAPEQYRPALYRRVTSGVLYALEQERSQERSREFPRPETPTRRLPPP